MNPKRRSGLCRWVLALSVGAALILGLAVEPAGAQQRPGQVYFSVEEEFVALRFETPDGNPIISDGDLLAADFPIPGSCRLVARNKELLQAFQIEFDLGLDAALVLDDSDDGGLLAAFSTSLDAPDQFTAGDLLVTNGAIIPNSVLLDAFDVPPGLDVGLDALECRGDEERCREFFRSLEPGVIDDPDEFRARLEEFGIDILFSTEGTAPFPDLGFHDGDLLSVMGGVVIPNSVLFANQPGHNPPDSVDYGLDAFTFGRQVIGFIPPLADVLPGAPGEAITVLVSLFSSEIVSIDRPVLFTDGDVLRIGASVFSVNSQLTSCFGPRVRDLGLDALHFGSSVVRDCNITTICTRPVQEIDPLTGLLNGAAFPCDAAPVRQCDRPFGGSVFIDGQINLNPFIHEYRVTYQSVPGGGSPIGIVPQCDPGGGFPRVLVGGCALASVTDFQSDADGWVSLDLYNQAHSCNGVVPLTIWDSRTVPDGLYELVLEVRERQNPDNVVWVSDAVRVAIDNTPPECFLRSPQNAAPGGTASIEGWVSDEHFLSFTVSAGSFSCGGGAFQAQPVAYPLFPSAPPVCSDGPGPIDCMGSTPSMTNINLFDVGPIVVSPNAPLPCCVAINMVVTDSACRGRCRTGNPAFPSFMDPVHVGNQRSCLDCFGVSETVPLNLLVEAGLFQRGDANSDGGMNISDGISILDYLFEGGREPGCMKAADVDDSGVVDITDASYLLANLFSRGPAPPAPYGACGSDPTPDDLYCNRYEGCSP